MIKGIDLRATLAQGGSLARARALTGNRERNQQIAIDGAIRKADRSVAVHAAEKLKVKQWDLTPSAENLETLTSEVPSMATSYHVEQREKGSWTLGLAIELRRGRWTVMGLTLASADKGQHGGQITPLLPTKKLRQTLKLAVDSYLFETTLMDWNGKMVDHSVRVHITTSFLSLLGDIKGGRVMVQS
jgi:hypothetical protein